jgi:hypothetical protein
MEMGPGFHPGDGDISAEVSQAANLAGSYGAALSPPPKCCAHAARLGRNGISWGDAEGQQACSNVLI